MLFVYRAAGTGSLFYNPVLTMGTKNEISLCYPYIKNIFINQCIQKSYAFLFYLTSMHFSLEDKYIKNTKYGKLL